MGGLDVRISIQASVMCDLTNPHELVPLEGRANAADSQGMPSRAVPALAAVMSMLFCLLYAGWTISVVVLAVTGEWGKAGIGLVFVLAMSPVLFLSVATVKSHTRQEPRAG
jgi:hypothetical protein